MLPTFWLRVISTNKFEANKRFCLIKRKREREKRGAERGREIDEKREGKQKRIRLRERVKRKTICAFCLAEAN